MAVAQKRQIVVNTIGTLGYFSTILQWAWAIIIIGYPLLHSDLRHFFLTPKNPAVTTPPIETSPVLLVAAGIITILVLIMTVIVLIRLPKTIGKSGARTTQVVAHAIIPTVVHHKKVPKKQYLKLSYQIVLGVKYLLVCLPLVVLVLAPPIESLSQQVIAIVALFCAAFSFTYFTIQAILVELLHVNKVNVW